MRWLKRAALGLAMVLGIGAALGYHRLAGSLPALDGEIVLEGLAGEVRVERDAAGVPTVGGANRTDVARALGFLHGQERFFQMDLMRRRAAGELAALVGEAALPIDRRHRLHRMRHRAARVLAEAAADERALLEAYVSGVNAGLSSLSAPPFEYLLLRQDAEAWRFEDSILVVLSMFFELNDETGAREASLELLHEKLPRPLVEFLTPRGTEWDAPLVGEAFSTPPVPDASVVDLREEAPAAARLLFADESASGVGSNSWAVAAGRAAGGNPLLANDMHLGHAVPNIWYRAVLEWEENRVVGVTLPGTPSMVVGSNGWIAWGFTNSNGDWVDLVELERDEARPDRYRAPDGWRVLEEHRETIEVRGGEPEELLIRETTWGPLYGEEHAIRWIAHEPDAVNLKLMALETARSLGEALDAAQRSGIPPQNFLAVDRSGRIGWTLAGRIPKRAGFDGRLPVSWADGDAGWDGFVAPERYPRVVDPADGLLWTANARVVEGEALRMLGDGGYALGARAMQIRDDLRALGSATEKDLLAVQLDDRALFLGRWRGLFLEIASAREELSELEALLDSGWRGRASLDDAGYRAVVELRDAVRDAVFAPLLAPATAVDERLAAWGLRQWEGPLWKLVSERPPHLVPPPHESWESALGDVVARRVAEWETPLRERTWGAANVTAVRHPLSPAVPVLSRFLDMAPRPLPGHTDMPRVQQRTHGASERLVVSPGREEKGLFHMPGGQSGHPLSPYYGAGHEDWEQGRPTPLLPGETRYRLTLVPR